MTNADVNNSTKEGERAKLDIRSRLLLLLCPYLLWFSDHCLVITMHDMQRQRLALANARFAELITQQWQQWVNGLQRRLR